MAIVALVLALALGAGLGYLAALLTATPLLSAWQERQRVEQEARLAELRLRHVSHQAMQRLLREARQDRTPSGPRVSRRRR